MQEDYKYDVFLSYKRRDPVGSWVQKFLYHYFCDCLSDAIGGKKVDVFLDQASIEVGDDWKQTLKDGLRRSKILLAVCSPGYFQSDWCLSEWKTFALREAVAQTKTLRIPIRHNDGEHFHEDANAKQMMDFSDCTSIYPAFVNSPKAIVFEEKVGELARAVAKRLKDIPPFNPCWEVADHQSEIRVFPGNIPIEHNDLSGISTTRLLRIS